MMRRTPRVSIGLPVYNGERFLREAVDSLLGQSFGEFELILADNASTDETPMICRAYAAADSRVRYIRNEANIGVYRNFNRVFQLASGEYFKWAAADDVCHKELLARCLEVLDTDPSVVAAYAKTKFVDEEGRQLNVSDPGWHLTSDHPHERMRYVIFSENWINLFFGLIRADQLAKTRIFPAYPSGDYRLLGELSLLGKFYEIPEYLFQRRIHRGASSQNSSLDWESEFYGGNCGGVALPFWHLCLDHFMSIVKAPTSFSSKLYLIQSIFCRMLFSYRRLLREVGAAVRYRLKKMIGGDENTNAPI